MTQQFSVRLFSGLVLLTLCVAANATLESRAGGTLVYDTDRDITWLADLNYMQTIGADPDGLVDWTSANSFAENLIFGGSSAWRLPITPVPDITCFDGGNPPNGALCGSLGPNLDPTDGGELGHLYELEGTTQNLTDFFTNFPPLSWYFWYGTEIGDSGTSYFAYHFNNKITGQLPPSLEVYAAFVADGDIALIPLPPAIAGFAVASLLLTRWKRKQCV